MLRVIRVSNADGFPSVPGLLEQILRAHLSFQPWTSLAQVLDCGVFSTSLLTDGLDCEALSSLRLRWLGMLDSPSFHASSLALRQSGRGSETLAKQEDRKCRTLPCILT